jgi:selenocysteine lyase/cysteine desulfurase
MAVVSALPPELQQLRGSIPLLESTVYLASCSQGPLSTRVEGAVRAFMDTWNTAGLAWEEWGRQVESARAGFAAMINAGPEDVAVGTSMSQLVSSVVSAYVRERRAPRRRIVSSLGEFPGVAHAWLGARAYGWRVDQLAADAVAPLDPLDVISAVDEDTAIVSVPHVSYQSGAMLDVDEVIAAAHARGAAVFIDAYQSLGTVPIDVRASGADFLASGTAKYLLGTPGIDFLYVRQGLREQLEPTVTGWFGRTDPFAFDAASLDYAPTASRFDLGSPPVLPAAVADCAIDAIREAGPGRIRSQVERLVASAMELGGELGLRVLGPKVAGARGAMVAFDAGTTTEGERLSSALLERDVVVSPRGRAVRLSPHGFTLHEEMEHAVRELARLAGR